MKPTKQSCVAMLLTLTILPLAKVWPAQNLPFRPGPSVGGGVNVRSTDMRDSSQSRAPERSVRVLHSPQESRRDRLIVAPDRSSSGDTQVSITMQQTQQSPAPTAEKSNGKKFYVPPRWVETEHGVEILVPGFWTDDPKLAGVKEAEKAQRVLREY